MNTTAHPKRSLPMPLWLQGSVELALVALASYLTVVLLLAAIWYTNGFNSGTLAAAISAAGHIWLLIHGVPLNMNIPEQGVFSAVTGTMSLVPLGLTLIPLALCYRAGRRLARASYEGQFWQPLAGGLTAYALVGAGVSLLSTNDFFSTSPTRAALVPLWVAALGILLGGYAESRSLAAMIGVNAADWVKKFSQYSRWAGSYAWALLRAALVSSLAFLAGGALLLALTLFWHWAEVVTLYQSLRAGAVGDLALTLLQLGLLVNLVVYAMAWSSGAGFALGEGTSVDLTGTNVGVMPSLPVLGALPHATEPWGYLALAVPLAAGALGGWWFFREGENHYDEWLSLKIRYRWLSWTLSTLGLAVLTLVPTFLLIALLGWAANGSLGLGRFTAIGPHPLIFGAYSALLLALGTMLGLALAHLLVRDTSGELERFAQTKPTREQKKATKAQAKLEKARTRIQRSLQKDREVQLKLVPVKDEHMEKEQVETELAETEPATELTEADPANKQAEPEPVAETEEEAEPALPFRPVVRRPKSLQARRQKRLEELAEGAENETRSP
ncbi:cell division protein PerM [Rothia sp. 88186D007BW]